MVAWRHSVTLLSPGSLGILRPNNSQKIIKVDTEFENKQLKIKVNMNKFDIKDGEYTSTIYGLIKVESFAIVDHSFSD